MTSPEGINVTAWSQASSKARTTKTPAWHDDAKKWLAGLVQQRHSGYRPSMRWRRPGRILAPISALAPRRKRTAADHLPLFRTTSYRITRDDGALRRWRDFLRSLATFIRLSHRSVPSNLALKELLP
jgi:hypothetical protein